MTDRTPGGDIARTVADAKDSLPKLRGEILSFVSTTNPIELLSHLMLLHQSHPVDERPYREEAGLWHVKIEWLAWLIFSNKLKAPNEPALLDSKILALEALLTDYFHSVALTVMDVPSQIPADCVDLYTSLRLESLFVRGEGFQHQFERMGREFFEPHDDWCRSHIGLTIQDAFLIAHEISRRFSDALQATRSAADGVKERILENPTRSVDVELPPHVRSSLPDTAPDEDAVQQLADSLQMLWFFLRAPDVVGFSAQELHTRLQGKVGADAVDALLGLISIARNDVDGEADPFVLTPLAKNPLVRDNDRYYLFVPAALFEAIFYAFHSRLFADQAYRSIYDSVRASLMERAGVEAFRQVLPQAISGWGLAYGPKKTRFQLDGLVQYRDRLILIEAKWKSLRLVARSGNIEAAVADLDDAILAPLRQAQRARDLIRAQGQVEFTEVATDRKLVVHSNEVSQVHLVTLVGSGAWVQIAANLRRLAPAKMFSDGEYPWALSLNDLRVVADCLAGVPSQLFDYLLRRDQVQRDSRFQLHDEWDFLGVYLHGLLDVAHPKFAGHSQGITLDGFDTELQDYHAGQCAAEAPQTPVPRRDIPNNIKQLLLDVETMPNGIDIACMILRWSDEDLGRLGEKLKEIRRKTIRDGRAHAVGARHPWQSVALTLSVGFRERAAIQDLLERAFRDLSSHEDVREWLGVGIDLHSPYAPLVLRRQSDVLEAHRGRAARRSHR